MHTAPTAAAGSCVSVILTILLSVYLRLAGSKNDSVEATVKAQQVLMD